MGHNDPSESSNASGSSSSSSSNVGDDASVSTTSQESHHSDLRTSSFSTGDKSSHTQMKKLADAETKRMNFWKTILLVSILLTGAGVCTSVYLFLTDSQETEFENKVCTWQSTLQLILTFHCRHDWHLLVSCFTV
jgi:hypothetical protein